MTNHLALAVKLNADSKAELERAEHITTSHQDIARERAAILAAQAQVHATLFLAERTHP